jgi:branched-chain amino acid transport system permease protein
LSLQEFVQTTLNGLTLGMMYVLIGSGITLMFGIMHIVNFAHGVIFMAAAFCHVVLYVFWGVNFFLSLLVSACILGVFGIILGRVCFEPFRGELDRSFITSLGVILVLEASMLVSFGNYAFGAQSPLEGVVRVGGIAVSWERVLIIVISFIAMILLTLFIKFTKLGQAMVASAQDDVAAMLQGIDLSKVSAACMFIGCFLAGIAGVLVGTMTRIEPYMGGAYTTKCFMIVALGGLGSLPGALVGGLILGFLEAFGTLLTGAAIGPLIAFVIVIILLLFRPRGLLGHA